MSGICQEKPFDTIDSKPIDDFMAFLQTRYNLYLPAYVFNGMAQLEIDTIKLKDKLAAENILKVAQNGNTD